MSEPRPLLRGSLRSRLRTRTPGRRMVELRVRIKGMLILRSTPQGGPRRMRRSNLLPLALGPPIPRQVVLYAQPIELALGPDVDIGPDRVRVVQRGGGEVDLVGLAIRPPQELRAAIGA